MTDPLTQSKIDELHHQLDAHRRVSVQNQERMRLIIHNHKKSLEAISITNKLQLEKQATNSRRGLFVVGVLFIMLCALIYANVQLATRLQHLNVQLVEMGEETTSNFGKMKATVQGLEVEQHDTQRTLNRTRKNLGSD